MMAVTSTEETQDEEQRNVCFTSHLNGKWNGILTLKTDFSCHLLETLFLAFFLKTEDVELASRKKCIWPFKGGKFLFYFHASLFFIVTTYTLSDKEWVIFHDENFIIGNMREIQNFDSCRGNILLYEMILVIEKLTISSFICSRFIK